MAIGHTDDTLPLPPEEESSGLVTPAGVQKESNATCESFPFRLDGIKVCTLWSALESLDPECHCRNEVAEGLKKK